MTAAIEEARTVILEEEEVEEEASKLAHIREPPFPLQYFPLLPANNRR